MSWLEKHKDLVAAAVRFAIGWHLAYLGVWAITSTWNYSSRWAWSMPASPGACSSRASC